MPDDLFDWCRAGAKRERRSMGNFIKAILYQAKDGKCE